MCKWIRRNLIAAMAMILATSMAQAQMGQFTPQGGFIPGSAPYGPSVQPVSHQSGPIYAQPSGCSDCGSPSCSGCDSCDSCDDCGGMAGLFRSDRAFCDFIGPISSPVISKDPRTLTEARLLFIHNKIDGSHPLGSGDFQLLGLQVRVALSERLSFIADKDGYIWLNPDNGPSSDGWANVAAGLKYLFVRDVENRFLLSAGFQFQPQSGESAVLQGHGDGLFTFFMTAGQGFGRAHVLSTIAYELPVDNDQNSSFFAWATHFDYEVMDRIYALCEVNWFHYFDGGTRGVPLAIGEGADLLNIGTTGVNGNDLVTVAFGMKTRLSCGLDVGVAWELPVSGRRDLLNNRILFEAILRY